MNTYSDGSEDVPLPLPFAVEAFTIHGHRVEFGYWQVQLRWRRYDQDWSNCRQETYVLVTSEELVQLLEDEASYQLLQGGRRT